MEMAASTTKNDASYFFAHDKERLAFLFLLGAQLLGHFDR